MTQIKVFHLHYVQKHETECSLVSKVLATTLYAVVQRNSLQVAKLNLHCLYLRTEHDCITMHKQHTTY